MRLIKSSLTSWFLYFLQLFREAIFSSNDLAQDSTSRTVAKAYLWITFKKSTLVTDGCTFNKERNMKIRLLWWSITRFQESSLKNKMYPNCWEYSLIIRSFWMLTLCTYYPHFSKSMCLLIVVDFSIYSCRRSWCL